MKDRPTAVGQFFSRFTSRAVLAPSVHEQLLIGSDCLLFKLGTGAGAGHKLRKILPRVLRVQYLLTAWEEPRELA